MRPNAARRRGKAPAGICVPRSDHAAFLAQRKGQRPPPPRPHLFTSTRTINQDEPTRHCSWCLKEKP